MNSKSVRTSRLVWVVGACAGWAWAAPPVPVFTDATAEAGIDLVCFCPGTLTGCQSGLLAMIAGGTAGDFDRDGRQDLFLLGGGGAPDKLYMNGGDGTFTDRAAEWGVGATHMGVGAAVGDYDADGLLDIYVTSLGPPESWPSKGEHRLYRNLGDSFVDVAAEAGVAFSSPTAADGFGASFGDWDLDGDLDLVVAGWQDTMHGTRLFENQGDGTFVDVTDVATTLGTKSVHGFSPRLADMDGDRYPELLIAADFESSRYLANNGDGTFTDVTGQSGTAKDDNGMGAAIADVDNDGLLDWFVTSIFGMGLSGNYLYWNQGGHEYLATGAAADSGWAWGAAAADYNLDGWIDIVVGNGWSSGFENSPSSLFVNCAEPGGLPCFVNMAEQAGIDHTDQARGVLSLDYDDDGDQDVLILTRNAPARLYRNEANPGAGWVRVFLDTAAEPGLAPDGIGSLVRVRTGELEQLRMIEAGTNYLSQSELSAHFGLGGAASVDELTVEWPNGRVTSLKGLLAGQTMTIAYCPADADGDGQLSADDFVAFRAAFADEASWADADANGSLDVFDFVAFQMDYAAGCP